MSNSSISANDFMPPSALRRTSRSAVWTMLWTAFLATLSSMAAAYAEHRRAVRARTELSALSDRMLKDIGVDRGDIQRIVRHGRAADELMR